MPTQPVLTSANHGWTGLTLATVRLPPGEETAFVSSPDLIVATSLGAEPYRLDWHLDGAAHSVAMMERGRFTLIPPGEAHRPAWDGAAHLSVLRMDSILLDAAAEGPAAIHHRLAATDPDVSLLTGRLLSLLRQRGPDAVEAEALGHRLAACLMTRYSSMPTRLAGRRRGLAPQRLAAVLDAMQDRAATAVTVAELAADAGLSPAHFLRSFQLATGKPPHAYMLDLRVERAQALLRRRDRPVSEVAAACGFVNASHFSRAFRARTGLTPRAWRDGAG